MKSIVKKILSYRQAFFKKIDKDFYSQFGEDKILKELIPKVKTKGFYVDVGCFHPKKHSNTYLLYRKGWTGINIDLEQDKIDLFNIMRPKDFNCLAAISDKIENVIMYRSQKFGVGSTINPNILEKKNIIDQSYIKTNTLNNVISKSPFADTEIDLLNIDAEGNDFKVLKSLEITKYKPKIIIIETHLKDVEAIIQSEIYFYLKEKGYRIKSICLYSLIFINDKFYENI
jgi:hypothetical protein